MEKYPKSVSRQCSKVILDQMDNLICKINKKTIGFFSKIKYNTKTIPILIANYQAIKELNIEYNKNIEVIINRENISLELGEISYLSRDYDLIFLELKEKNINKVKFLDFDENLFKKDSEIIYDNKSIYIIHYGKDKNFYSSYGIINYINKSKIICSCNIDSNSKGSPIFNLLNNKLIGIYIGKSKYYNKGISFNYFINKFINIYENKLKNNLKEVLEIIVNVDKDDINKKILFLGNYEKEILLKKENITRKSIEDLNELNTKLSINNKKIEYKKYFVPKKEGKYNIKLEFDINLTDSSFMFAECENIIKINFINFNTENITDMESMFFNCKNLVNINLFSFNTKNVINLSKMFYKCYNLKNLDLSSFKLKKEADVSKIFYGCKIDFKNLCLYCSNIIKEINIRNLYYEILPSDYPSYEFSFKIILIGDCAGKNKLMDIISLNAKDFITIHGYKFNNFIVKYFDKIVKLQIWETNGQEIYRAPLSNFYRNSSLAILLYSIDNIKSFEDIEFLLKDLRSNANYDIKIILVGNKIDIEENQ